MKKFMIKNGGILGKAIALLFYTEIINQITAFLVHKNTSKRVKS